MRLLYAVRETVNPVIERCGGHPLPLDENDCWYWTSTEVSGQETAKVHGFTPQEAVRCGDPEDTGTQGEADYHTEQVGTKRGKVQRQWKKAKNYKGSTRYSVRSSISPC